MFNGQVRSERENPTLLRLNRVMIQLAEIDGNSSAGTPSFGIGDFRCIDGICLLKLPEKVRQFGRGRCPLLKIAMNFCRQAFDIAGGC
jgi:hypothetical protein